MLINICHLYKITLFLKSLKVTVAVIVTQNNLCHSLVKFYIFFNGMLF